MNSTLKVTLKEKQSSDHNNSEKTVTKIDVYSSLYEENQDYQNTVLNTDYAVWQKDFLREIFTGLNPNK